MSRCWLGSGARGSLPPVSTGLAINTGNFVSGNRQETRALFLRWGYERRGGMKSEMKIQIVLGAILVIATLISVNALVSAVQKGPPVENGANIKN